MENRSLLFRNRWWIVFASVLGVSVSNGAITISFAEFLKPMAHSLALGRGEISSAIGLALITTAVASPLFGRMLDRWGVRPVLLPSILLFAATVAALSRLEASPVQLYALFALVGFAGAGQTVTGYSKAVSSAFDSNRGLALGIALSGVGLGVVLVPTVTALFISYAGWRSAWVGLGMTIVVLAFVPVLLCVREVKPVLAPGSGEAAARPPRGLTTGAALAGWRFWVLFVAFFLVATAALGTLSHIVALLTDRGLPLNAATAALSASGAAIIAGRILSGICLDRFFGPHVAVGFFACPIFGIVLLWHGAAGIAPILAAVLCGLGVGALHGLTAFFVGRYFGLRSFGTLFGMVSGASLAGFAAGSNVLGWTYQVLGSYEPAEMAVVLLLIVACSLFLTLGPYPFPAPAGTSTPSATPQQAKLRPLVLPGGQPD